MYRFFLFLSILLFSFLNFFSYSYAAIDLNVVPIKYEITAQTWSTITRSATLINNGPESFTMYTWKSDFVANGNDGTPRFVRYSELVHPDQQLSSWITIDTDSFVIGPGERKTINFTIEIPADATPGGHYWAVFFKNNNSETSTSGNIGINVDYGILVLLNVDGEVITDGEVGEPVINTGWGWTGSKSSSWWAGNNQDENNTWNTWSIPLDNCPFGDLSPSNIDGTCIGRNLFIPFIGGPSEPDTTDTDNQPEDNNNEDKDEDFEIIFELPFENTWNTHIKPEGSIVLIDEDGKEIKQIGRKVITNDNGAVIGEEIVDYIPLNDNGWSALPNTTRVFTWEWKWFPYKEFDDNWEQVIKYWDPGEYYTKENIEQQQFLQLWERVAERRDAKTIEALINFSYTDEEWEEIEFNSAKEFEIEYTEQYVWVNPYIIIFFLLFWIIIGLIWWFLLVFKRTRMCKKCDTKVRKNWEVCPNCKKKLKHNTYKGKKKKQKKKKTSK